MSGGQDEAQEQIDSLKSQLVILTTEDWDKVLTCLQILSCTQDTHGVETRIRSQLD